MKALIANMMLALTMSPNAWAGKSNISQSHIPAALSSFSCVEETFGNNYRILKHDETMAVGTVSIEEWSINQFISATAFQVASAEFEGDMVLVIKGYEMSLAGGTDFAKLELRLSTTIGENHSVLQLPSSGNFSCSFPNR